MDDWQKDFWEAIENAVESVAVGLETFVQEVTQAIEEIQMDIEQFVLEVMPIEIEEFFSNEFPFSESDNPADFGLNPKVNPDPHTHPACIGCQNYHGYIYGGNLLVCALHPYGWEDESCPDWQGEP
jgi:hypothetical protein